MPIADGKVGPFTSRLMALYWQKHDDPAWSSPVRYP
jgi:branched-chain amino acid aminotransferase